MIDSLFRALAALTALGLSLFALAALAITVSGMHDRVFAADMLIVLGNQVMPDGQPHPRLAGRLDAALALYQEKKAPLVFVSGGVGVSGFDEATVMAQYLRDRGVPENALIIDSKGINSRATAENAAAYMRSHQLSSAIIVTQFFHVPRSMLALKQEGIAKVGGAHAEYYELRDLQSLAREVVGYVAYALRLNKRYR